MRKPPPQLLVCQETLQYESHSRLVQFRQPAIRYSRNWHCISQTPPKDNVITLNATGVSRNYYPLAFVSPTFFFAQSPINPLELLDYAVFYVLVWVPSIHVPVLHSVVTFVRFSTFAFLFPLFLYSFSFLPYFPPYVLCLSSGIHDGLE